MIKKHIHSLLTFALSLSIILSMIPPFSTTALAAPVITAEYPQSGESTLSADEHITEDCYITGTVNGSGYAIYIDSGKLTIQQGAVVNADIYLNKKAILQVDGTVNGTITMLSNDSPDARISWDGTLARPNNLEINSSATVHELVLNNPHGFGGIAGFVEKITYSENYGGEVILWSGSYADEVLYNAETDVFCDGSIGDLIVNSGGFGINTSSVISKVTVTENGRLWVSGTIDLLLYQSSDWLDLNENARIDTIVLNSQASGGFSNNQGCVTNLIVENGSVYNSSYIENVFLKNCLSFTSVCGEASLENPYIIKNLISENCMELTLSGAADGSRKYGDISIHGVAGSHIRTTDLILDSISLTGTSDYVEIWNFLAQYVYLDVEALSSADIFNLPDPNTITALNLTVSQAFYDKNADFIKNLIGSSPDQDVSLDEWTNMFLKISEERTASMVEAPQSITLTAGDTASIAFISYDSLGFVQVYAPSGDPVFTLTSSGENVTGNFLAEESGEYRIETYGAKYGGAVDVQVIQANQITLNTYIAGSCAADEQPFLMSENISSFTFTLFDETTGMLLNNYILKGSTLYLMPDLNDHRITIQARHYSQNWGNYWGYVDSSVTFTVGTDFSVDVICKAYGSFDTWIEDSVDLRAYLYNDESEFCGTLNNSDGSFWSDPLPSGEYSVIFIRDSEGLFRFQKLADYRRYGLHEGRDYTAVTFENKDGLQSHIDSFDVPSAPVLDWPGLVRNTTAFTAPVQSGAVDTLFDLDLRFQFEDPTVVSDVSAAIVFSDDCTIMGNDSNAVVDNVLTIPLTLDQTQYSICITSAVPDTTLSAQATLTYTIGTKQYVVLIGSVNIDVVSISCSAQTATDDGIITVYGNATPNNVVIVFDDGSQIAAVTAGSDGYWSANVQLAEQTEGYHSVNAAINANTPQEIKTQAINVYYAAYMPKLKQVTFDYQVHGHSDHIVLSGEEWSGARWRYDYWPDSIFTFQIKLSNSENIDTLSIASTSDGSYYSIPGYYDEESGLWIATGQFCKNQNYTPGDFIIGYVLKEDTANITLDGYLNQLEQQIGSTYGPSPDEVTVNDSDLSFIMNNSHAEVADTESTTDISPQVTNVSLSLGDYETTALWTQDTAPEEKSYQDYLNDGYTPIPDSGILLKSVLDSDTEEMQLFYVLFDYNAVPTGKSSPESTNTIPLLSTNGNSTSKPENGYSVLKLSGMNGPAGDVNENIMEAGVITVKAASELITGEKVDDETWEDVADELSQGIYGQGKSIFDSITNEIDILKIANERFHGDKAVMEVAIDNLTSLKQYTDTYQCPKCNGNCQNEKCNCQQLIALMRITSENALTTATDTYAEMDQILGVSDFAVATYTANSILAGYYLSRLCDKLEDKSKFTSELTGDLGEQTIEGITKYAINSCLAELFSISEQKRLRVESTMTRAAKDIHDLKDKIATCDCGPTPTPTASPTVSPSSPPDDPTPTDPSGTFESHPDVGNDPAGYVYEAVTSNRLSDVTATVYYQSSDNTAIAWDASVSGQSNPQVTLEDGRYQWFVPSGFWCVEYAKTGYDTYTTEWMRVPPPRVDVNIPLTSSRIAQVESAYVTTDYAEVSFDKYLDVATVDGFIKVDGLSTAIEPMNAEASGLGDGKTYASTFRAVFTGSKAIAGNEYNVSVAPTATCYAGINNAAYEQKHTALLTINDIHAEIPDYVASGDEITIPVTLLANSSTEGVTIEAETSDASLVSIVSVSEPKDNIVNVTVDTAKAGAATITLHVTGTTQTTSVPVIVARSTDTKLIAAVTDWNESEDTNYIPYILLASFILCIGTLTVFLLIRKRKMKSAPSA